MNYIGDKSQFYDKGLEEAPTVKFHCHNGHDWQASGDFERSEEDGYVSFEPHMGETLCPVCGEEGEEC